MGYQLRGVARLLVTAQLFSFTLPVPARALFSPPEETRSQEPAALIAGSVSGLAPALQQGDLKGQAAGVASGVAGNRIEGWMQRFGTAHIQLSVDEHGHPGQSSMDWLLPLYESPHNTLFTQLGYRAPDGRRTVNMGLGVRTFIAGWMYGINTFLDKDYTGHNRRVGIGAEAWRDDLKLSANSYFSLTGWHQSRDFSDYDERPADGWDIRAEAWLPAYPQLGGRLVYEQYHGNEVALADRDNRQRNPSAITAGLSYTPIPLATAGVDYRTGPGGQNETQFSVKFRYQPGTPWPEQISPDAVRAVRTLAGSRLDLVERNNTIVLRYRKQDLLKLTLPKALQGTAGDSLLLSADITSKYALSRTEWNASPLLAAGGKITGQTARSLRVVLPVWRVSGVNQYPVSAVAYDVHGNASGTAVSTLTVLAPVAALADGSVTIPRNNAPADGKSANEVQAKVTDGNGNPLSGQKVAFTAGNGALPSPASGTTGADGLARASLTSLVVGNSRVTATLANGQSSSATATFVDALRIAPGDLTVTQNNAAANGVAQNRVQAKVTDGNNQPLSGQTVKFSATNGAAVSIITGTTGPDGLASAGLTSRTPGSSTVTATLGNGASSGVATIFTPLNGIALRNITVIRNHALSDGADRNTVSMTVTDGEGVPVSGQAVMLTATNGAVISPTSVTTDGNGNATVNLTSVTPGDATLAARLENGSEARTTVTFIAAAQILAEDILAVSDNAVADGSAADEVTVKVTRGNGDAVAGQAVTFTASNDAVVTTITGTTGADGVARARLTSTVAGNSTVTASLTGGSSAAVTVHFITAAQIESGRLTVTADNAAADGKAMDAVQLRVVNGNGAPVAGLAVSFSASNGITVNSPGVTTDADGLAGVLLTSTHAGDGTVTARLVHSGETASAKVAFNRGYAAFANIEARGFHFSVDSGFPSTGFNGALFYIDLPAGLVNTDYTWTSSAAWARVAASASREEVIFNGAGSGESVTITATPLNGSGPAFRYTFSVKQWFIWNDSADRNTPDYNRTWCASRGYKTPSYRALTGAAPFRQDGARGMGSLWSEWGDLSLYHGTTPPVMATPTYMADESGTDSQYSIRLTTGWVYDMPPSVGTVAVCTKPL